MAKRLSFIVLPICVLIALSAAFLFVSPAFAQDEVPPQVAPTEAPAEVPTEAAPAEVTPTEAEPAEVLPTEAAPEVVLPDVTLAEESPVEVLPTEEAPAAESILAESLTEAGVTLADPSGSDLTLASQDTLNRVTAGDPYFTVGSLTYHFVGSWVAGGCTGVTGYCEVADDPIFAALDYMETNTLTPTDRKLYIEPDIYNEDVYLDGSLTGVKGLLGIVGKGASPEDVVINGWLYITNFLNGFSLENLSVNGDPTIPDDGSIWAKNNKGTLKLTDVNANASGEDGTGIIIFHNGAVELKRVNSSNNDYMGAFIVNYGTGPVTITNSSFDNNARVVHDGNEVVDCNQWDSYGYCTNSAPNYVGLNIAWAGGPVNLFGVSASVNLGDGVQISAYNSTVTVKSSVFNENEYKHVDSPTEWSWGDGLWIDSKTVTLEKVQANNNGMRGIFSYANASFSGLRLVTDGNGWSGTEVNACFDWNDGDPTCDNPGAGTVTINASGSSQNGGDGYNIKQKGQ